MKTYNPRYDILIYAVLIISSALAALFVVKNIKISPDAMRFGLISQQILSGNGIRVPIIRLEDNYVPVKGAIPFLDQMPLLPILLALLGGVTPQNFLPAQIVNLISHAVISLFIYLIMKNLCNRGIALLTGIIVSFSYSLLWLTNHISSDPLFVALTVATMFFLILTRNSNRYQFSRNFVLAGILAGAAILTRNAGIALIPVFFWEAFILVKDKRPESKYVSTILAIILPVITTMAMFARNYIISGSLRGFNESTLGRSYISAITGTVEMIFKQFQLGKNGIILSILFIILFILYVLINVSIRKEILKYFGAGLDLIIVFIVSYTSLICLTMAKQQWRFELRYVSPLGPFLIIISILMIVFVWDSIKLTRFSRLSLAGMILSLSLLAFGSFYKTYLNFPEFIYKQDRHYFILNSCTYKWIKENYGRNMRIATNRPYHLSFFGGYSTIALPHKRYNPGIHVPDHMESVLPYRMSKFGAKVLALFEEAEEQYEGAYIARLFNKRGTDDKFSLAYECSDGVVYTLKKNK